MLLDALKRLQKTLSPAELDEAVAAVSVLEGHAPSVTKVLRSLTASSLPEGRLSKRTRFPSFDEVLAERARAGEAELRKRADQFADIGRRLDRLEKIAAAERVILAAYQALQ